MGFRGTFEFSSSLEVRRSALALGIEESAHDLDANRGGRMTTATSETPVHVWSPAAVSGAIWFSAWMS